LHMLHYKLIRLAAIPLVMIMYASTAEAGVIAWYPLHGDASAIVGNDGTLVNAPTPAPDEKGTANGALNFAALPTNSPNYSGNNSGSYVSVAGGAGVAGLQQGTIALWVNWSGMQGTGWQGTNFGAVTARQGDGVFSNNVIGISDADPNVGTLTWRPYGAGAAVAVGATPVGDNVWHFVAVTWDGTTGEHDLYLDGKLDGQDNSGTNLGALGANAASRFTIGAWIDDGSTYSNSTIHDVYIFNTVLSPSDLQTLQTTGMPPP
jgi:Concanavalin A-like lectin/glucanases superfamily